MIDVKGSLKLLKVKHAWRTGMIDVEESKTGEGIISPTFFVGDSGKLRGRFVLFPRGLVTATGDKSDGTTQEEYASLFLHFESKSSSEVNARVKFDVLSLGDCQELAKFQCVGSFVRAKIFGLPKLVRRCDLIDGALDSYCRKGLIVLCSICLLVNDDEENKPSPTEGQMTEPATSDDHDDVDGWQKFSKNEETDATPFKKTIQESLEVAKISNESIDKELWETLCEKTSEKISEAVTNKSDEKGFQILCQENTEETLGTLSNLNQSGAGEILVPCKETNEESLQVMKNLNLFKIKELWSPGKTSNEENLDAASYSNQLIVKRYQDGMYQKSSPPTYKPTTVLLRCKGFEFYADKNILTTHSSVLSLKLLINSTSKETSNKLVLDDLEPEVLREILRFMYTGTVSNWRLGSGLLKAAVKYELEKLKNVCECKLFDQMNSDNVFEILVLADEYKINRLKQQALEIITFHAKWLVNSRGFHMFMKSDKTDLIAETFKALANVNNKSGIVI